MSPDPIVLTWLEDEEGEVYQYTISGVILLITFGKSSLNIFEYIVSASYF